jgi:ABC-type dipeptide/oligopeptide/nickel transport system ATPase subunit
MLSLIKTLTQRLHRLTPFLQKRRPEIIPRHSTPINTLAPKILTEQRDLDRVKPYLENLKNAIDTSSINNIAITGSYGSGKSTILRTFENQYKQYKYLNISLASFTDNKEEKNGEQAFERRLEISILQQMFYHVAPSVIPDSRFKRIVNVTRNKLLLLSAFLILWILSALILVKFGYIEKLNPTGWKTNEPISWTTFFSSIVFFTGIGLFVKNVYRLFSNSKISKLNIKGELEFGEAVDKSVFNQHLEEILYFFERTDFNVVVIEDVDRFNSTDIFTKLREINILINNSDLIKRPIKFLYAIKDEMFTDKNERVKFFEYIIPIIPFINPSNANDQLTKLINEAELQGVLSPDFTSDVLTFIDDIDMRLLINIFQEY